MVERRVPDPDCLDGIEEEYSQRYSDAGYNAGFELGQRHGEEEGHAQGFIDGAKRGSEIGFYRGLTMTWIKLIQARSDTSSKSIKSLNRLQETMDLVEAYPRTNEEACDVKLDEIRAKFKQSTSLLNIKINNTQDSLI